MFPPWIELLRWGPREQVLAELAERPELALAIEPQGMSAIFLAVSRDDVEIVRALLRCGASATEAFEMPPIEAARGPSFRPIQFARSLPVLHVLIEAGADLRHARLGNVVRAGRADAVDFLLAGGVVPSAEELREAPTELLSRLAERASPEVLETAMRWLCEEGRADAVEVLLARGVSLASGTALAGAAAFDHVDLVRRLLDAGADPDATLPDGSTPLIDAAFEAAEASALLLLDAGADPARANRHGQTALDGARESEAGRLLARLLERD
jgi:ankyrin repeat protein